MMFDRLCQLAEKWLTHLRPSLERAALFTFDKPAHELLKEQSHPDAEEAEFLNDTFFLPFPHVALEDPGSVILLKDLEDSPGLAKGREFVELIDYDRAARSGFFDGDTMPPMAPGSVMVNIGTVSSVLDFTAATLRWRTVGTLWQSFYFTGDRAAYIYDALEKKVTVNGVEHPLRPGEGKSLEKAALQNANTALEEIWLINTPHRFVLEEIPRKVRDPAKSRLIPRSHERPRYTLLEPSAIRHRMRLEEPKDLGRTGKKKVPHERRKHYRTMRSERYKAARGKTILIPAIWVGPTETKVGNKKYRVRVDL